MPVWRRQSRGAQHTLRLRALLSTTVRCVCRCATYTPSATRPLWAPTSRLNTNTLPLPPPPPPPPPPLPTPPSSTAYITTHGELERNTRRIARRYLRGAFVLDVLAALPLTALLRAAGAGRGATGSQLPWLGLLKLARLATIGRWGRGETRKGVIHNG